MGLVVTIVLLFFVFCGTVFDSASKAGERASSYNRRSVYKKFEEEHYDVDLQKKVWAFQEQNPEAVLEELSLVADQLQYWNVRELEKYKSDIMMANRGKCYINRGGYSDLAKMVVKSKDKNEQEKGYELAKWFQDTLNKQGKNVELCLLRHHSGIVSFEWKGSRDHVLSSQYDTIEEFSRRLIDKDPVSIPKPYYENE